MPINQIILEPAHGHMGEGKTYERGHTAAMYAETDLVPRYLHPLVEELELSRVRHKVLAIATQPGLSTIERVEAIEPHSVVICCHVGAGVKKLVNGSGACYGTPHSKELAVKLCQVMHAWGKGVNWVHANFGVKKASSPLLDLSHSQVVEIEPFYLDLPGADAYASALEALGRMLGEELAAYGRASNPNLAIRFQTLAVK